MYYTLANTDYIRDEKRQLISYLYLIFFIRVSNNNNNNNNKALYYIGFKNNKH